MQLKHLLALVVLSISGVLCAASCVQNPIEPIGDAQQDTHSGAFDSKDFPFVVEVKDDGGGAAGG
jgi:hypothetical protein